MKIALNSYILAYVFCFHKWYVREYFVYEKHRNVKKRVMMR